jgi:hypothetical protein
LFSNLIFPSSSSSESRPSRNRLNHSHVIERDKESLPYAFCNKS